MLQDSCPYITDKYRNHRLVYQITPSLKSPLRRLCVNNELHRQGPTRYLHIGRRVRFQGTVSRHYGKRRPRPTKSVTETPAILSPAPLYAHRGTPDSSKHIPCSEY